MPITVTAPRGQLTPSGEREILPKLTEAWLEAWEAIGNRFVTSIVGGTVHILDPEDIYASGINRPVVTVELKLRRGRSRSTALAVPAPCGRLSLGGRAGVQALRCARRRTWSARHYRQRLHPGDLPYGARQVQ